MEIDYSKLYQPKVLQPRRNLDKVNEILEIQQILYVISKKIILYRKENKITQKQLAEKLEVNQTMISKLESGKYNPTFKQIYKITRKLTNDSELYKKILEEIVNDLNKFEKMQYSISIFYNKNEEEDRKHYLTKNKIKDNIRYLEIENYYKGEEENEEYSSEISDVG